MNTSDGQYRIEDSGPFTVIDAWPTPEHGLTTGEDQWFVVLTGVEWGPLDVEFEFVESEPRPEPQGWEVIAERQIRVTGNTLTFSTRR